MLSGQVGRALEGGRLGSVSVRSGHEPQDWLKHLGRMRDTDIARRYGVHPITVLRTRHRLGIPRYDSLRVMEHLLGTMPDTEVARIAGCSVAKVHARRTQLGIPRASRAAQHDRDILQQFVRSLEE